MSDSHADAAVAANGATATAASADDACAAKEAPQDAAPRVRSDIRAELAKRQLLILRGDEQTKPLTIQAPMVRCSRAAFRRTCQTWGTDVVYTHMFMAESIAQSEQARAAEVSFIEGERNIVAQIAAKDPCLAGQAAAVLAPFVDAIDINCGCPQRWAIKDGIGSALMQSPQLVAEMVKTITRVAGIPCVVKTRVFEDPARSVDWARQQEAAGAHWVTIHGRLPTDTPSYPVRWETVRAIREALCCPVVLNGGVDSLELGVDLARRAGVGGVMSARGLLENPAMFGGHARLPKECLAQFMRLAVLFDTRPSVTQLHLTHMLEKYLTPAERGYMGSHLSYAGMIQSLRELDWLPPVSLAPPEAEQ